MRDIERRHPRVIELPGREEASDRPLYPLAVELGELKAMTEKLLYRVQQGERREQALRGKVETLQREVARLKRANPGREQSPAAPEGADQRHPTRGGPDSAEPDFGSALDDLNRH